MLIQLCVPRLSSVTSTPMIGWAEMGWSSIHTIASDVPYVLYLMAKRRPVSWNSTSAFFSTELPARYSAPVEADARLEPVRAVFSVPAGRGVSEWVKAPGLSQRVSVLLLQVGAVRVAVNVAALEAMTWE